MSLPSYNEWKSKTNAGLFASRGPYLQILDALIQRQGSIPDIKKALSDYLAKEDDGTRNTTGMINRLMDEVGLDFDFGVINYGEIGELFPEINVANTTPPSTLQVPHVNQALENAAAAFSPSPTPPSAAQLQERQRLRQLEIDLAETQRTLCFIELANRLGSLDSGLTDLEVKATRKVADIFNYFKVSLEGGIQKFVELHRQEAEDIQFNITIGKGICSALQALPFPLSFIGKAGEVLVGLAQTNTTWEGFQVDNIPTPKGFVKSAIGAAAAVYQDVTTLNTNPTKLANHSKLVDDFCGVFDKFKDSLFVKIDEKRRCIGSDEARQAMARESVGALARSGSLGEMRAVVAGRVSTVQALKSEIERIYAPLLAMRTITLLQEARLWIAVKLIADLAINGLCKGQVVRRMHAPDVGAISVSERYINFLASEQVGIIVTVWDKTEATSNRIYSEGKIPWDNRRFDVIGLMLFLEWFKNEVNPFDLMRPDTNVCAFKDRMTTYIKRLGEIMVTCKATSSVRSTTVTSMTEVRNLLNGRARNYDESSDILGDMSF